MDKINKVLFIGDPHFKVNNNSITDVFVEKCLEILKKYYLQYKDNFLCVIGGDLLDTHERLHQTPYNKMLTFIKEIKQMCKVIILVGNHDYENNQQFLTDKHWMNALKEWKNVEIVDKVYELDNLFFVPYVPPGKFISALNTFEGKDWKNSKCIFAHQEFRGCNLGIITSESGDKWPLNYPLIISGHIHMPHRPQKNIIYPGSVIQHSFSELKNNTGLCFIDFEKTEEEGKFLRIPVDIPKMILINISCNDFEETVKNLIVKPLQRIKIVCSGKEEHFKNIKKTKIYRNLDINISLVFKNTENYEAESDTEDETTLNNENVLIHDFLNIFTKSIEENDKNLLNIFTNIVKDTDFNTIVKKFITFEENELFCDLN